MRGAAEANSLRRAAVQRIPAPIGVRLPPTSGPEVSGCPGARGIIPPRLSAPSCKRRQRIIDCHGHYTTAPADLQKYRDGQIAGLKDPASVPQKANLKISDDQIRDSLEGAQLKFQRERGTDLTIFSPRASAMSHHIGDETTSQHWTQACNDLIKRVCDL